MTCGGSGSTTRRAVAPRPRIPRRFPAPTRVTGWREKEGALIVVAVGVVTDFAAVQNPVVVVEGAADIVDGVELVTWGDLGNRIVGDVPIVVRETRHRRRDRPP